ncbi:MAG: hypothetical protein U0231_15885 [Nitrospiraceae bacterium]
MPSTKALLLYALARFEQSPNSTIVGWSGSWPVWRLDRDFQAVKRSQ